MSSSLDSTTASSMLEELKRPWSASSMTDSQKQRRDDLARAKKIWDGMMMDFRQKKIERAKEAAAEDSDRTDDEEASSVKQPFPLLNLSGEIRNVIYDFTLKNDTAERKQRGRKINPRYRRGYLSTVYPIISTLTKRAKARRMLSPTPQQRQEKGQLRKLRNQLAKEHLQQASLVAPITTGCSEAFDRYKLEHDMYTTRCPHEEHDDERKVVPVNARGNLCEDLPLLSLINRQVFTETFYLFYSTKRSGLWFRWSVKNLDFFPFLRFWMSLTSRKRSLEIKSNEVHVKFDDEDEGKDRVLHITEFKNVNRLVEMHWLEGFPLWGCLSGLTDSEEDQGPFFDWMYSFRQIVALYRIDRQTWREQSIIYLQKCESVDTDGSASNDFAVLSDPDLVERTIDMICNAIEYNLGYDGNFSIVGRNGREWDKDVFKVFRYKRTHRKTAYEREHIIVLTVGQYRRKVDRMLRERLQDGYEEWERLPDEVGIPKGVVL